MTDRLVLVVGCTIIALASLLLWLVAWWRGLALMVAVSLLSFVIAAAVGFLVGWFNERYRHG